MVVIIVFLFLFLKNYKDKNLAPLAVQVPNSFTANAEGPSNPVSLISPDGKITVTMKRSQNKDLVTYTFNTNNLVYTKDTVKDDVFSIPFNTWSPDNKYFFIKEIDGNKVSFLILNASGVSFKNGSQFINVSDIFREKLPTYSLIDATGWAAGNLLIINSNKSDGSEGPSFWFDIPSGTFIQLSNRFN